MKRKRNNYCFTPHVENDSKITTFCPTDFTDVGQASLLARAYPHRLCYCEKIGWLVYKDGIWLQSDSEAQGYSQKLTTLQMLEAERYIGNSLDSSGQRRAASSYYEYAESRRSTARIAATLKEAIPMLRIDVSDLDADPIILNTPSGEVHLDTGECMPHDPEHHITHITSQSPSEEGAELWGNFLRQISCEDDSISEFLQQLVGMAAIGKVYEERLVIALGSGGNGKSTFFNAIQSVLGDYAGTIRSDLLISSNDSGKKFEFAAIRGKRFILTEELEEGKQLDTAALKHLCSTGDIHAQFKGKDVFTFKPSHSTILCTNHTPTVRTADNGTWDRLIVVPFNGRFRNQKSEIKNYGAYLVDHCGGAILQWIIEGAKKYIRNDYKLVIPEVIQNATNSYRTENDWTLRFCEECLSSDPSCSIPAVQLYDAYRAFCQSQNIPILASNVALPQIEKKSSARKKRSSSGIVYLGIKLVA